MRTAPQPGAGPETSDAGDRRSARVAAALLAGGALYWCGLIVAGRALSWDEIEYFRATDAVARGEVPYRDFYEHHTPLQWYLFAPVAALVDGPGVATVQAMRWAQLPLWAATFALLFFAARRCGATPGSALAALALLAASAAVAHPAVEYRVDAPGILLLVAGLALLLGSERRRARWIAAGAALGGAVLANLRLAPIALVALVAGAFFSPAERRWRWNGALPWLALGGALAALPWLLHFAAHGALGLAAERLFVDNALGDAALERDASRFAAGAAGALGLGGSGRAAGLRRFLDLDLAGVALCALGLAGTAGAVAKIRSSSPAALVALVQVANLLFVMRMRALYAYHFLSILAPMAILAAAAPRPARAPAVRQAALGFASLGLLAGFTNLHLRNLVPVLHYQDLVMRETDRLVPPGAPVWDGVGYTLRRPPVRRDLGFFPTLVRSQMRTGRIPPLSIEELERNPPGAILFSARMNYWFKDWPALAAWAAQNYAPYRQHEWLPMPNARLGAGSGSASWTVLSSGDYRIVAAEALAAHPWFRAPAAVAMVDGTGKFTFELRLDVFGDRLGRRLVWAIDGAPVEPRAGRFALARGERLEVSWRELPRPAGLFLVPAGVDTLFRMPPLGVDLNSAGRFARWPESPGAERER